MTVELRNVDRNNWEDILRLKVAENQREWVAPNAVSLAQAYALPECVPLAVYAGGTPVGFVMYALDPDDGEYWIYRLMIDAHYQNRGYGRAALRAVLTRIARDESCHSVFISAEPDNQIAFALYESEGFRFDGRWIEGERVMVLEYRQSLSAEPR
ncbi:MAG: GNAT family N-acetyltransferase [Eubacteriales bacterium]|nr:GNAT family N-acetyltransferase [Eubacteriales bacterium]